MTSTLIKSVTPSSVSVKYSSLSDPDFSGLLPLVLDRFCCEPLCLSWPLGNAARLLLLMSFRLPFEPEPGLEPDFYVYTWEKFWNFEVFIYYSNLAQFQPSDRRSFWFKGGLRSRKKSRKVWHEFWTLTTQNPNGKTGKQCTKVAAPAEKGANDGTRRKRERAMAPA